ncbi:MAG: hypothetical protein MZV70_50535 [Desulfobacterales bacterium]|nr:hypothetical protein [Desulfobacterales bacterium]
MQQLRDHTADGGGRAEEPGMAGHPTDCMGVLVVDLAFQGIRPHQEHASVAKAFAGMPRCRSMKKRSSTSGAAPPRRRTGPGACRYRLDDPAQDHEVQIAVEHPLPRPVREGLPAEQLPAAPRHVLQKRTGCQLRMIGPVVRQAGGGEQLSDGHAGLVAARKHRQHGTRGAPPHRLGRAGGGA